MSVPGEGLPSQDPLEQLALRFSGAVMEQRAAQVIPRIYRELWRQVSSRLAQSREPIVSKAAVELAFELTLKEFTDKLSAHAKDILLTYLVEQRPALDAEPVPDDFYLRVAREVSDPDVIFNRIVAGLDLSEHDQLSFDDESPADTF